MPADAPNASNSATTNPRTVTLLRGVAFALLLGAAWPLAAQAKFIPTFLVYYGGGPALTGNDAAKLAKFDLLDLDRFRYKNIGPNSWAKIKSINPNVQIYLYQMGPEVYNNQDALPQLSLNTLGRYNVSRGHPMGSLNGNSPGLFQVDAAGRRIYSVPFSKPAAGIYSYLLDFGSSAFHSYWVAAVKADIIDQPWVADGIFTDNCLTLAADGGYSATSAWYNTTALWANAMNRFAAAIAAGVQRHGQKLWCNKGGTRLPEGVSAWQALDASATRPDVLLEEGAFAVKWGAHTQFFTEAMWKRQVDILRTMKNTKVAMLSHTQLSAGQSGTDNWGKPVTFWQTLWYALGSFLLGKNDALGNAYFMFTGGSGYDKIWWFDEYDRIDLGRALGPYAVRTVSGVNVYFREFERGSVYVNPTATDVASVSLPRASRRLTRNNLLSAPSSIASVNAIALPGHQAAILLNATASASSSSSADTSAPSVPGGLKATAVSATQINLSWNASTDNVGVKGYNVYLNDDALATTTSASFRHTGLTPGATYSYRVSAFDAVPNHSAWTATPVSVTAAGGDTTPPSVPRFLRAATVSGTRIELLWNPSLDNVGVKGYYVYLNDTILAATTATSFQHMGLTPGQTYNYRVSAFDAVPNHSAWTATPLSVKTLGAQLKVRTLR